ncbi:hypothetical protein DUNSADRAFT_18034 [Dunaliella salina]|uniref:Uncharacterized protein n=1 Tax=Dunaliella salina TaxID=3046 RepID=A0ABQ7G0S1_DUNSA|nr:hypothetical protein DUNSADRAFT_18034 [Dunaliella salina]|eukprot:KAF5828199.1 hypothetical protein DUNSADRAFT_18034 [Dunaliella salina]
MLRNILSYLGFRKVGFPSAALLLECFKDAVHPPRGVALPLLPCVVLLHVDTCALNHLPCLLQLAMKLPALQEVKVGALSVYSDPDADDEVDDDHDEAFLEGGAGSEQVFTSLAALLHSAAAKGVNVEVHAFILHFCLPEVISQVLLMLAFLRSTSLLESVRKLKFGDGGGPEAAQMVQFASLMPNIQDLQFFGEAGLTLLHVAMVHFDVKKLRTIQICLDATHCGMGIANGKRMLEVIRVGGNNGLFPVYEAGVTLLRELAAGARADAYSVDVSIAFQVVTTCWCEGLSMNCAQLLTLFVVKGWRELEERLFGSIMANVRLQLCVCSYNGKVFFSG